MLILTKLLFAHFLGDFVLQPVSWVRDKEQRKLRSQKFYLHVLLHGLLYGLVLGSYPSWWPVLLLTLAHAGIDLAKMYNKSAQTASRWFLIDQGLHLTSILIIWYIFYDPKILWQDLKQNLVVWIYVTALIGITFVASIVIRQLLAGWEDQLPVGDGESLRKAGKYIGMLERLFVFTFVVTQNWTGIGFLLAAKSVFRFGDLRESKDRKLTEYILVGTLLSFGIALFTGLVVFHVTS